MTRDPKPHTGLKPAPKSSFGPLTAMLVSSYPIANPLLASFLALLRGFKRLGTASFYCVFTYEEEIPVGYQGLPLDTPPHYVAESNQAQAISLDFFLLVAPREDQTERRARFAALFQIHEKDSHIARRGFHQGEDDITAVSKFSLSVV